MRALMKPKAARIWLARKRSKAKWSLTSRSVKRTKVGGATAAATSGLTIEASVPNCDIEVDGSFAGSTPSTLNLAPGKHDIVVKKTGYKDWTRSMTVASGTIRVSADMVAAQ